MDHNERADELEKEAERLERESEKLGESTDQARSDWEARKADPSSAPGAAAPEDSGPHNIDAEDPATGRKYGEQRQEEMDDARAADSEGDGDDSEDGDSGEEGDNDST